VEKEIKEMELNEILRKQLELLAEASLKTSTTDELIGLSHAIVEIVEVLS